jgi:peptidoglycan/LPS O-acetylase OafA/YrhL
MVRSNSLLELGNLKVANRLGKYTYGIYLIHPITLLFAAQIFRCFHFDNTSLLIKLLTGFSGIISGIFLSILRYHYFETPFLKLKTKFSIIVKPDNSK